MSKFFKSYKKIALALSLCAIVVWAVLGTGTSIAWFSHSTPELRNVFHVADFELEVSYRLDDGTYVPIDGQTKIFNDEALYEPGYVQVVFFKVENKGDRDFDFKTAVNVIDYTVATNVFGQHFNLQDYLLFGLVPADTESDMDEAVSTREKATQIASVRLNNYATDKARLRAGETAYMALVVRMPEQVDNVANYRGGVVPKVVLGIIVDASQTVD